MDSENFQKTISESSASSFWYFVIITLVYTFIKIHIKDQNPMMNIVWGAIYLCLIIIVEIFINLNLTNLICGSKDFGYAFSITAVPWLIIFGVLNILLVAFPGWLTPFSNTFGYFFAKLGGIRKTFEKILKPLPEIKNDSSSDDRVEAKTLANIYNDNSLLLNEITEDNFEEFWANSIKTKLIKEPETLPVVVEGKKELLHFVKMKKTWAECIWYILTGGLVTSVTYNYIVNSGCETSLAEQNKRAEDYRKKDKEIADKRKKEKKTTYTENN
jgi:hypothetical protein